MYIGFPISNTPWPKRSSCFPKIFCKVWRHVSFWRLPCCWLTKWGTFKAKDAWQIAFWRLFLPQRADSHSLCSWLGILCQSCHCRFFLLIRVRAFWKSSEVGSKTSRRSSLCADFDWVLLRFGLKGNLIFSVKRVIS